MYFTGGKGEIINAKRALFYHIPYDYTQQGPDCQI